MNDVAGKNRQVVEVIVLILLLVGTWMLVVGPAVADVNPTFEKQPGATDDDYNHRELPETPRQVALAVYGLFGFCLYGLYRKRFVQNDGSASDG